MALSLDEWIDELESWGEPGAGYEVTTAANAVRDRVAKLRARIDELGGYHDDI